MNKRKFYRIICWNNSRDIGSKLRTNGEKDIEFSLLGLHHLTFLVFEEDSKDFVFKCRDKVEQCFSTFFRSRHPFWLKTFSGTLTLVNYFFAAPFISFITNIRKIQYLAAPLGPLHGTLVENHWSRELRAFVLVTWRVNQIQTIVMLLTVWWKTSINNYSLFYPKICKTTILLSL